MVLERWSLLWSLWRVLIRLRLHHSRRSWHGVLDELRHVVNGHLLVVLLVHWNHTPHVVNRWVGSGSINSEGTNEAGTLKNDSLIPMFRWHKLSWLVIRRTVLRIVLVVRRQSIRRPSVCSDSVRMVVVRRGSRGTSDHVIFWRTTPMALDWTVTNFLLPVRRPLRRWIRGHLMDIGKGSAQIVTPWLLRREQAARVALNKENWEWRKHLAFELNQKRIGSKVSTSGAIEFICNLLEQNCYLLWNGHRSGRRRGSGGFPGLMRDRLDLPHDVLKRRVLLILLPLEYRNLLAELAWRVRIGHSHRSTERFKFFRLFFCFSSSFGLLLYVLSLVSSCCRLQLDKIRKREGGTKSERWGWRGGGTRGGYGREGALSEIRNEWIRK